MPESNNLPSLAFINYSGSKDHTEIPEIKDDHQMRAVTTDLLAAPTVLKSKTENNI